MQHAPSWGTAKRREDEANSLAAGGWGTVLGHREGKDGASPITTESAGHICLLFLLIGQLGWRIGWTEWASSPSHAVTHTHTQIHAIFTWPAPPPTAPPLWVMGTVLRGIFPWLGRHVVLGLGRSMTMGGFMGRKLTVQFDALTNVVVPSVIMP